MSAEANALALARIASAEPVLTGTARAADALGLAQGELGHAGPPFESPGTIPHMVLCALAGAARHEGWAGSIDEAKALIMKGSIRLIPNHDLGTVSPMAGIVRPSQALMRLENRAGSGVTYATLAEAGRQVLRFGVYNEAVATGLRWLDDTLAPALSKALPKDGLPIMKLVADGVELGDDVHQRNIGGMMAFIRALPDLDGVCRAWLFANPQHFLNYAMAACKLSLDLAEGIEGSSIVTAITRNGVDCGIRVAGMAKRWFTAPAVRPIGGFFSPFIIDDAQADLGDSAIVEAYGLGGAIAHASPEIAKAMGRSRDEAVAAGALMRSFFVGNNRYMQPAIAGTVGVGQGLDAARVAASGQAVRIHTGIGHKDGKTGWIGVGVAEAPLACFTSAMQMLEGVA
jgi:hypothetical protein